MFDIAWSEMIVIGAVALIAIGPKDLPKALRAVGAMTAKARRMASEFQDHFREAMREAELESVKEEVANINRDLSAATSDLHSEFNSIGSQMPSPPTQPLQLSGEATELDIPGLPPIDSKPAESATPPATGEALPAAEPAVKASAPEAPPSAEARPSPTTTAERPADLDPKKPARKKRAAKPKASAQADAASAANDAGSPSPDTPAEPSTPKPARKRAAKTLPSGDDQAA